jgi:hypothetical protein
MIAKTTGDIRRNGSAGSCRCFASGLPWAWRSWISPRFLLCVRTRAFPIASDERQRLLTFSRPDCPFRAAVIAPIQGEAARSMTLARFLRLFSCYGGSLSSSTSGADGPLPGTLPSFRQVPDGV